jgi:cation-transporting ATPase E
VAALARQAGLDGGDPVNGRDLSALTEPELDRVVGRTTVFGRIAPEQKERLVGSLRRQGRYVAMIGDGVNDARALERAQVGVAMRSGSAVTRDVADIVLTDDSLAALLPAQHQGRRIISGIGTSMQAFLARVATQGMVIVAVAMHGLGFPCSPGPGPAGLTRAVRHPGRGDHGCRRDRAYRFRLLDRALGLAKLPAGGTPRH